MSFETPSDRFQARLRHLVAGLKRFFLLQPLDGFRLLRTVWLIALIIFGLQILGWFVSISSYFNNVPRNVSGFWVWWELYGRLFLAPLGPLLELMIIRLVLEACTRVLRKFPADVEASAFVRE